MEQGNTIARNFTILPEQEAALVQLAKDKALNSVSAALRIVIAEWQEMKAAEEHASNGHAETAQ